jgi:hypothetical protein
VSLSLLALIYGVEEASSGLNNAHRFQLEFLVSSFFLSVFSSPGLCSFTASLWSSSSLSFFLRARWLLVLLLGGFRKIAGHHDLRCSSGLLQLFQASLLP